MSAAQIAAALAGKRYGDSYVARCPAHDDRTPSLSISQTTDGMVLVRCHAGCDQSNVIEALLSLGLWAEKGSSHAARRPFSFSPKIPKPDEPDIKRTDAALAIWRSAQLSGGTLVDTYLKARGLHQPKFPTLRFHPGLKHQSGGLWPTMVALVTRGPDNIPLGIHRTYLARDGNGKAPVDPQKMMLGPCSGGAVRLADHGGLLMVGEGIETCLSAIQATGNPAWAALSTSGLQALRLPKEIRDVIVLADGDEPGEAAARNCAERWVREGRRVRIARPPKGMDFNDILGECPCSICGGKNG